MSDLAIHAELQERIDCVAVDTLYAAREGGKVMDEAAKLIVAAVVAEVIPKVRESERQRVREALRPQHWIDHHRKEETALSENCADPEGANQHKVAREVFEEIQGALRP